MIDGGIELHRGLERVAAVPGGELMRGPAGESVLHRVDVETTDTESGPVAPRLDRRMAAHQDVGAFEHARLPQDRLGGWIDLLGGGAVDDDWPRAPGFPHLKSEEAKPELQLQA